ncbi:restriction endonuclease subunit S [Metamycoplasma hyosynoviae]|uniref:restriction endonuclease subunit S n=1 Tax=Metamycoplasma hyosynoviae TaxID=29559 RepID=UPI002358A855|nr:restriction endonuclease subunit S [Metamycoplasma hyosynoviae]MDC8920298.1 restriction endonuclease subunit S [Metamycoplasma hyosynoviae]MDD1366324.1 restriction endonuclease subunit S [Metamycoplasma hyosynoviae]MDD7848215.1 restriction endonuclease subunit S [Metamycoplasma hyosynoviae]
MALSRLGDYIELVDVRNIDGKYGIDVLKGISIKKVLTPTKANTRNLDLKSYKVLKHNWFTYSYVTSRNGNKISIAYNDDSDCIISSINPVFRIKDNSKLLSRYLMMFFNRSDFDRYARFNSWGSARETFNWDDFCNIEFEIPSVEIQKKYVSIYETMLSNLRSYEKGIDDLKLVCQGYIESLRKKYGQEEIGKYIQEIKIKNKNKKIKKFLGISQNGFILPKQKINKLENYNVFGKNNIVYSPIDFSCVCIYKENDYAACSPIYVVFKVKDENILNPDYLMMWLKRTEFSRLTEFYSINSVRNMFSFDLMSEVKICIPNIKIQNNIVNILNAINSREKCALILKSKISSICPILIRGSILESQGGK